MNSLNIVSWNGRSILGKKEELLSLMNNIDIMVCVESWLKPGIVFNIPGYKTVRKDREVGKGGGVIIFIANYLKFKTIESLDVADPQVEICGIEITNLKNILNIIACYRPPGRKINSNNWDKLLCNISKMVYRRKSNRLSSKKTDWGMYQRLMDKQFGALCMDSEGSVIDRYNRIVKAMKDSVAKSTPRRREVPNHMYRNPVPWWDKECDISIRLRKAAFKKWQHQTNLDNWFNYKRQVATTKKLLKKKKRDSFKKFASELNYSTSMTYFWNTIKTLKSKWVNVKSNIYVDPDKMSNSINRAIDKLCPPWVPNDSIFTLEVSRNDFLDAPFDFSEFIYASESVKLESAPGLDGVEYRMIYNLSTRCRLILLDILNEIYTTGSFPEEWTESQILLIKKSDGENFRPISLTSCMCKFLERLINLRLQWWCEDKELIPANQSGFRKGRSCLDNINNLTSFIHSGFNQNEYTMAAFLDVSAAF
ncbi:uncharacterized protein LOC144472304 [Augochlora pura]